MAYGPVFLFIVSMSKQVIGSAQLFAVTKFDYLSNAVAYSTPA